jgi:hypothetical protein
MISVTGSLSLPFNSLTVKLELSPYHKTLKVTAVGSYSDWHYLLTIHKVEK